MDLAGSVANALERNVLSAVIARGEGWGSPSSRAALPSWR